MINQSGFDSGVAIKAISIARPLVESLLDQNVAQRADVHLSIGLVGNVVTACSGVEAWWNEQLAKIVNAICLGLILAKAEEFRSKGNRYYHV